MATVLPKEINYQQPASLPADTRCDSIVASAVNGQTFGPSSIIQFDLVNRGYMVPSSMYLRFKCVITGGTAPVATNFIRGTPAYSWFSRLETIVGSSVVESIQGYNQISNMLINCRMNYAQKVGLASAFGYSGSTAQNGFAFDFSTNAPNGQNLSLTSAAAPATFFYAIPLWNILSNADNLIPLGFMPGVRIQLSTETVGNAIQTLLGVNAIVNYVLSNCELCYDVISFSPLVDMAISQRGGGQLVIKSQSYLNSGVTIPATSVGQLEYIFNSRLASIKSIFTHLSHTVATVGLNTIFDSADVTSGNGEYQYFIAGTPFPIRPLSTVLHGRAAIAMELSAAFGPSHDLLTSQFAITPAEATSGNTTTTTQGQMAKFYLGVNCEKLSTNDALLTGTSSQNSPISLRIGLNVATTNAQIINLICLYDALLQIDMGSKTLTVMQ